MKRIEVAVGIILDHQQRVLVGQRIVEDQYFQKWEFPGGKLENGESAEQALVRELKEELGIEVGAITPLMQIEHDYPDRSVRLFVQQVLSYQGEAVGEEGQHIAWVEFNQLQELDFLQGNQAIVEYLKTRMS